MKVFQIVSQNITWTKTKVTAADRARRFGERGAVVWMTGLSGSGKSTLAVGLDALLYSQGRRSFVLDGDNMRHGLGCDLGFSDDERAENVRRTGEAAKLMAEAGVIAICALISPLKEQRRLVREACQGAQIAFIEVFICAPLSVCEARDPRGLYRRVRNREIKGFTGIDSPFEAPTNPDLLNQTEVESPQDCLIKILERVLMATSLGSPEATRFIVIHATVGPV